MDPDLIIQRRTMLRILPLGFALILACGLQVSTDVPQLLETEVAEVLNFVDATDTAVAERRATETAMVAATETALMQPTSTPTPQELSVSMIYIDTLDDCQFSDGRSSECVGIDIARVIISRIQNEDDLATFNIEARESGFVVPLEPITVPYPFLIAGATIQDFDADAGFICFNWADQQKALPPSDPNAEVLASCYNRPNEFLYVNNINASGQFGVEADPAGTMVFVDIKTGITFVQELGRIYRQNPVLSFDLLVVESDQNRFDVFRGDFEGFWEF